MDMRALRAGVRRRRIARYRDCDHLVDNFQPWAFRRRNHSSWRPHPRCADPNIGGSNACFAERRRSELTLQRGNERLQLALNAAELGTFSADLGTGDLQCDARAAMMHGHVVPPTSIKASR